MRSDSARWRRPYEAADYILSTTPVNTFLPHATPPRRTPKVFSARRRFTPARRDIHAARQTSRTACGVYALAREESFPRAPPLNSNMLSPQTHAGTFAAGRIPLPGAFVYTPPRFFSLAFIFTISLSFAALSASLSDKAHAHADS